MPQKDAPSKITFQDLELSQPVLKVINDVGYETPSPIQAVTIPLMLQGRDVLGQAQTGTGKTAAFALPILTQLNLQQKLPQVLVLAPTRELAIQVAEAFQNYARHLPQFHVLPVYGGQDYRGQIRALQRGVHVVVGTPGRVMDHIRKKRLQLNQLKTLVLDEADEMLRMGFIDDVEWIMEQTPKQRQIALFSATIPSQIRRIATKYLNNPEQITIKVKTTTAETIRQRYWTVKGAHKLDALTRILEAEPFDAMIVFVRTKTATVDLVDKLQARGHTAAALNGDIAQNQRERTVKQLKGGQLDILVATDVAARGLDVERVSHVINYDIPYDTEAYVHRIGRTGRAGKKGDAILFVAPRERRMLQAIEKATRKKIDVMQLPTTDDINQRREARFMQRITDTLTEEKLALYSKLISAYHEEHKTPVLEIAAALAHLAQGGSPLLLQADSFKTPRASFDDSSQGRRPQKGRRQAGNEQSFPDKGQQRFLIKVGKTHGVKPSNIVGAIANEAGIDSQNIGEITIHDDFSLVDLPKGMPKDIFKLLQGVWVSGQKLEISRYSGEKPTFNKKRFSGAKKRSGKNPHRKGRQGNNTKKQ